ncbi:MAG: hypothetical protein WBC44_06830 [Planctomycetaceae bacterium]
MADNDRDDLFGAGDSHDADRWPANEEGPQGELAPPQGKSNVVKILLIVLAVFVLGAVLCCGGAALIGWFAKPIETTQKAEEVVAKTAEIVEIDVPDEFHPAVAIDMNMFVVQMQMAFFEAPGRGVLMIAQAQGQGANEAQMEQQLRQSMQQQNLGEPVTVKETETKTIAIDGQDVDFQFATATSNNDGSEWKQVSGAFAGKNGTAFLLLQQPTASFDEEQVTGMLESISAQ